MQLLLFFLWGFLFFLLRTVSASPCTDPGRDLRDRNGRWASLAAPILSVYLPRTVVQAVTEGWEFSHLALGVGVLALGIMLLNILSMLSGIKYSQKAFNGRMKVRPQAAQGQFFHPHKSLHDSFLHLPQEESGSVIEPDILAGFGGGGVVADVFDLFVAGQPFFPLAGLVQRHSR